MGDEVKLSPLHVGGLSRLDVRDRLLAVGLQDGCLVLGGQVAAAEHAGSAQGWKAAFALQHDKAGQVLIGRSEPIADPSTCAGVT